MSIETTQQILDVLLSAFRASCPHGLGSLQARGTSTTRTTTTTTTTTDDEQDLFTLWHLNHYLIPNFSTSDEIRSLTRPSSSSSSSPATKGGESQSQSQSQSQSLVVIEKIHVKMLTGKSASVPLTAETTVFDIKKSIESQLSIPVAAQRLVFRGQVLQEHGQYVGTIPLPPESVVHLIMQDEEHGRAKALHLEPQFLSPRHHYDFTRVLDPPEKIFTRGGRRYVRPCGWRRFAVHVEGEYDSGTGAGADDWLGPRGSDRVNDDEWPAAYYVPGIGLLNEGIQALQGAPNRQQIARENPRVQCITPLPSQAALHAVDFVWGGVTYQFMVQIRFNPTAVVYETDRVILLRGDEDAPRPYGLLIRRKPA